MIERRPIDPSPKGREQWLGWRRRDVTAGSTGALFGVHPFQTIAGLYAEKMGMPLPGAPDPESAVIRRGNDLEDFVGAKVAKMRPQWRIDKNTEYLSDAHARIGATPDFWIEGDPRGLGVLQTKTVNPRDFRNKWCSDDSDEPVPPMWIILQNATEVMLADAAFGAVAVQVVGDYAWDTHIIEIPRHKPSEHKIRVAVNCFWQAFDAGQVPEIDYERDGALMALLYPREREGSIVDLTRDNRAIWLCAERARQADIIKQAEAIKESVETELKEKIGDHEAALVNGWRVTLKTTHRPEKLHKATSFRVLRTMRKEEETHG